MHRHNTTEYRQGRNEGEHNSMQLQHIHPGNYAKSLHYRVTKGEIHPQYAVGKMDAVGPMVMLTPDKYENFKAQMHEMKRRGKHHGFEYTQMHRAVTHHEQHWPRFASIREEIMRHNNSKYKQKMQEEEDQRLSTSVSTPRVSRFTFMSTSVNTPLPITNYTKGQSAGYADHIDRPHINPATYARGVRHEVTRGMHPNHAIGKLDEWEKYRKRTPENYENLKVLANKTKLRGPEFDYLDMRRHLRDHEDWPQFDAIREEIKGLKTTK